MLLTQRSATALGIALVGKVKTDTPKRLVYYPPA